MSQRFDLVAIGTGEAASAVAWKLHAAGRRVAVVDSRPYGGTCALRGCDPKKVLVGAADALPRRIAFVGGGYISFEFAHIAARAGAQATILHSGARPLEGFDPDLVDVLMSASRDRGIDVKVGAQVEGVEKASDAFVVHASGGLYVETDLVVHGAGRVPEIDDLGLEE